MSFSMKIVFNFSQIYAIISSVRKTISKLRAFWRDDTFFENKIDLIEEFLSLYGKWFELLVWISNISYKTVFYLMEKLVNSSPIIATKRKCEGKVRDRHTKWLSSRRKAKKGNLFHRVIEEKNRRESFRLLITNELNKVFEFSQNSEENAIKRIWEPIIWCTYRPKNSQYFNHTKSLSQSLLTQI